MDMKMILPSICSGVSHCYLLLVACILTHLASVDVRSESLRPCTEGCHCSLGDHGSDIVNCSHAGLSNLPESFSGNAVELTLSYNSLGSLDLSNFSHLPNLRKLVLSHCQLTNLTSDVDLSSLFPKLEVLDLSNNDLSGIPKKLPRSLVTLLLSHNTITGFQYQDSLAHMNNLNELFLDHNLIPVINTESFRAADKTTALNRLQKLALSNNKITHIESEAFVGLSHLTALTLAFNKLSRVDNIIFKGLKTLRHLDLAHNQLNSLGEETFRGLHSLKYLNLNSNYIRTFPSGLPMLEWLDMSYNVMRTISEDSKPDIYPVEVLNLAHNPFQCDCYMLWLKQLYDRREYLLKHIDLEAKDFVPSCKSPETVAGQTWDLLSDEMFTCGNVNIEGPSKNHENSRNVKNGNIDLTTRIGMVTDGTIQVMWSSSSPLFSAHNFVIQYYVFGHRTASTKHVEVAATQREHILKHLRPMTNYVICMRLRTVTEAKQSAQDPRPFSLDDCIEVSTKEPKAPVVASRVEILFYYVLGMLATFIGIFATVGGCAIIYGLWTHKNTHWSAKYVNEDSYLDGSTYATDEPIKADNKPHKD